MTSFGMKVVALAGLVGLVLGSNGCSSKGTSAWGSGTADHVVAQNKPAGERNGSVAAKERTSEADRALIENIVQQNKASRERIQSAIVDLKWTGKFGALDQQSLPPGFPSNQASFEGSGCWLFRGEWCAVSKRLVIGEAGSAAPRVDAKAMVLNDRYEAIVPNVERPTLATIYEHSSIGERSTQRQQAWNAVSAPHIFLYAFGTGYFPLDQFVMMTSP